MRSEAAQRSGYGLAGKVAAITGGGGVLCGALARALAGEGAKVALLDLRPEAAEARAADIRAEGGACLLYTSDAADDLLCVDLGASRIIKKKEKLNKAIKKTSLAYSAR